MFLKNEKKKHSCSNRDRRDCHCLQTGAANRRGAVALMSFPWGNEEMTIFDYRYS